MLHLFRKFNYKFPPLNSPFPRRISVGFQLAVTVESHLLASAGCAKFPKFVSNLPVKDMDTDPDHNEGYTDLPGESDFHPAAPATIVATPAVAHPGAGQSSAMVTRSRARGGREINVEPEVEFRPEIEFLPEAEIPAQTDEGVSGATRHRSDIASQYIPEVTRTQEVGTSAFTSTSRLPTTITTRNVVIPPHNSTGLGKPVLSIF